MSTAEWATEAADRILDLNDIEIKAEGWNKDATRSRIASIIAAHAEPVITALREEVNEGLIERHGRWQARVDALVALLRESRREHVWSCSRHSGGSCNCFADTWNARVDAVLKGDKNV